MLRHLALMGLLMGVSVSAFAQVSAVPNSLNFQGRLATSSGNPVPDGNYSVRFSLWDAASAGTEKWNKTVANVQVKNGTFAVTLDAFPAGTFNANLWLEVKVGNDAALSPRTPLVSVPYAMKSDLALTVPDGSLTAAKFASGVLNSNVWLLGGNSGTNPGSQFLGTTDGQPLVFRTNNAERLRIGSAGGLLLPVAFGANPDYVGTAGNSLAFGHSGVSEDALSYKNHTFFFKDSPGGGDTADPNVVVGGNLGVGTDTPAAKLHVSGGNIRLDGNQELYFAENGQIRSADDFHRLLFRRTENKMEMREFGDLIFSPGATAGTETAKVVMLANGNVGIGKAVPETQLDVNGSTNISLDATLGGTLRIRRNDPINLISIFPQGGSGGRDWWIGSGRSGNGAIVEPGSFFVRDASTDANHLVILPNGNMGVGTTIPTAKLDVNGDALIGGDMTIRNGIVMDTAGLNDGTLTLNGLRMGNNSGEGIASRRTSGQNQNGLDFYTSYNKRLSITNSGNVGVGIANPSYSLHVNGSFGVSTLPFGDFRNVQWNEGTGQFYYDNSSRRHKENITPLEDDFLKLLQAEPKTYTRPNAPGRWEIGFIAEEFDELGLKKLVDYGKNGEVEGINYEKICVYLTAIARKQQDQLKAQQKQAEASHAEIAELRTQNADLHARLERIEAALKAQK
jgi:hypothetical protein